MWTAIQTEAPPSSGPVVLPCAGTREPLLELLQDLLHATGAQRGTMELDGASFAARKDDRHEQQPRCAGSRAAGVRRLLHLEAAAGRVLTIDCAPTEESVAIQRRGVKCGSVNLWFAEASVCRCLREHRTALEIELGYLVTRCEIEQRGLQLLGLDIALCGTSAALRRLEQQMERAGAVTLPVVLEGEFGAHDVHTAAAIHLLSHRHPFPFLVLDCAYRLPYRFAEELEESLRRAARGTLFLSAIDLLDLPLQRQVLSHLRETRVSGRSEAARVIASCSRPLGTLSQEGSFDRMLRTELDYLRIPIPPLRTRREDIPYLLERHFRMHRDGVRMCFDRESAELCRAYDWPENEGELERVAARLAVMSDGDRIDSAEWRRALAREQMEFAPSVEESSVEVEESEAAIDQPSDDDNGSEEITELAAKQLGELPRRLVNGDFNGLEAHGISMNRALRYIGARFGEEMTLGALARESYVSPSHLSFLFKRTLGFPFKTVLAFVRIEKARQLLMPNQQMSITEISLEVGFGDLSHFERTFKRLVGTNPREFRRQQIELAQRPSVQSEKDIQAMCEAGRRSANSAKTRVAIP